MNHVLYQRTPIDEPVGTQLGRLEEAFEGHWEYIPERVRLAFDAACLVEGRYQQERQREDGPSKAEKLADSLITHALRDGRDRAFTDMCKAVRRDIDRIFTKMEREVSKAAMRVVYLLENFPAGPPEVGAIEELENLHSSLKRAYNLRGALMRLAFDDESLNGYFLLSAVEMLVDVPLSVHIGPSYWLQAAREGTTNWFPTATQQADWLGVPRPTE